MKKQYLVGVTIFDSLDKAIAEANKQLEGVTDRKRHVVRIWALAGEMVVEVAPRNTIWEPVE